MTQSTLGKEKCNWCNKKIDESQKWYELEVTRWNGDGSGSSITRAFHGKCHQDIINKGVNFSI